MDGCPQARRVTADDSGRLVPPESRSVPLRIAPIIYGAASAVLCLPVLAPAAALAAAHGEDTPLNLPADQGTKHVTPVSSGGSLVRTVVGLAIVLAVIYGIAWVLKQVKSSKEERHRGSGLQSTAVVPLGPNRALHLVRAGRELVLVGVAEHGVTPIRTYSEEEALELGLIGEDGEDLDDDPPRAGAVRWLDRLRDRTVRR
jgi:flagellar protein FliO/FliZ